MVEESARLGPQVDARSFQCLGARLSIDWRKCRDWAGLEIGMAASSMCDWADWGVVAFLHTDPRSGILDLGPSQIESVICFLFSYSWLVKCRSWVFILLFEDWSYINLTYRSTPRVTSLYLRATVVRYTWNGATRCRPKLFETRLAERTPSCMGFSSAWVEDSPCVESVEVWHSAWSMARGPVFVMTWLYDQENIVAFTISTHLRPVNWSISLSTSTRGRTKK